MESEYPDVLMALLREQGPVGQIWADLLPRATRHGVDALLWPVVRQAAGVPSGSLDAWRARVMALTATDAVQRAELARMDDRCAVAGVSFLVFKGAALARSHYPASWMRPHDDVDLWVADAAFDALETQLLASGYARQPHVTGPAVRQHQYRRAVTGTVVQFDVHVRFANPAPFAEALPYAEAWAASIPIAGCAAARALAPAQALFVACVHRVAHHFDAPDLIWLYDIVAIARRLSDDDWERFTALAERSGVSRACAISLSTAANVLGLQPPARVLARLDAAPSADVGAFVNPGTRFVDVQWSNLRAAAGWRMRLSILRQHVFPPAAYMQAVYGHRSRWLPLLYLHRLVTGFPKWFTRLTPPSP
jgi:hypothetical protein